MAYSGTTAATSLANPPRQVLVASMSMIVGATGLTTLPAAPGGQGGGLWYYSSTNLTTDLVAAGFFSDGKALGMKPGDLVAGVQFSSAGSTVTTFLGAITSISTAGAASMTTGSVMTSTFG
jgi:hypothetical protein